MSMKDVTRRLEGRATKRSGGAPEAMFHAYVTAALWSSTDESDESGGEPLDKNYDARDIADETSEEMRRDVNKFYDQNWQLLSEAGVDSEQAGHDFWLSRNGHGAGFFDRNLGELGDKLQDKAEAFGGYNLYVGDDGAIYGSKG